MIQAEFLKKYHYFRSESEEIAREEAKRANEIGIENDEAVAVHFGRLGWGLMLRSAAEYAIKIGIIDDQVLK